jgi:predicted nucleic-acid-binding protein
MVAAFHFEDRDVVRAALEDCRAGAALDFADCLIGRAHAALGSDPTATFDLPLRKLSTFHLL